MNFESSTIYTLGNALSRAQEEHLEVDVLVDGTWLNGAVLIHDGTGVVLDGGDEHSIVKVSSISAVRVAGSLPGQRPAPQAESARPMPGPREGS